VLQKVKILFLGCLLAGIYGALHDQLSYTLSPEYFTHFKFIQFHTPWAYEHPRIGASCIGFLASWWMGFFIAVGILTVSYMASEKQPLLRVEIKACLLVILVSSAITLSGLALIICFIGEQQLHYFYEWVWPDVKNPLAFIRVGIMHSISYLGGFIGLLAAIIYLLFAYKRF
jgi:hypothetical protein